MKIRLSQGSAAKLGLLNLKIDCYPETIFLMTYGSCNASCAFCSQSIDSSRLSRISWPIFELSQVSERLSGERRVCIQCLRYRRFFENILKIIEEIPENVPISISTPPLTEDQMKILKGKIDILSISLDAATPELFRKVKPSFSWEAQIKTLRKAKEIFGDFKVMTHLIAGLSESEEELYKIIQKLHDMRILSSLFAFTPIKGTRLESLKKPDLKSFRKAQLIHFLITQNMRRFEDFTFMNGKLILDEELEFAKNPYIYMTRGCPNCNRPYYTSTPRKPYNYPRLPRKEEMVEILGELKMKRD